MALLNLNNITMFAPAALEGRRLYNYYLWTMTLSDPRSKGFLFVDSPAPTIVFSVLYLTIVYFGPMLMKNRNPLSEKWSTLLLVPYNACMSLLNGYIFMQLLVSSQRLNYSFICEPCRPIVGNPEEMKIVKAIWCYYFSKLVEFMDTIFFIIRKKDRQLTFLHVYHHSSMFVLWWIGVKWVPSGSSFLPALVNSLVHVVMYLYYALSALNLPRRYLRWKKYLTMLQLVQFVIALVLGMNAIRIGCDFPLWMHYALCIYMISFLVLFGKFYIQTYVGDRKRRHALEKKVQ